MDMDTATMLTTQRFARVFVSRNRLKILWFLCKHDTGVRVGDLRQEIGLSAATLSRHLRFLLDAGLVQAVRDRNGLLYAFCPEALKTALNSIAQVYDETGV